MLKRKILIVFYSQTGNTKRIAEIIECNVEQYDTVFLGTPNWGNGIAHPLMTFLDEHKFDGKTIYPFCTHGGGGLAHIAGDIKKFCPSAHIGISYDTYGNGGLDAEKTVQEWLKEIEMEV